MNIKLLVMEVLLVLVNNMKKKERGKEEEEEEEEEVVDRKFTNKETSAPILIFDLLQCRV